MTVPLREYHCPQCGYDLRGQTVDRCPECGLHYDLPALRELAWQAFYAATHHCIEAARLLGPAGVVGIAAMFRPGFRDPAGAIVILGIGFLLKSRALERWVVGSFRQELHGLARLQMVGIVLYGGLFMVFRLARTSFWEPMALGGLAAALFWSAWGMIWPKPRGLLSLTPTQTDMAEQARWRTWILIGADLFILLALLCMVL